MGKHRNRRNKRQSKGNKQPNNSPYGLEDANNNDPQQPSSVLLQRIRHADPRTRHAALAAVANTLLDPSSKSLSSKLTPPLLQSIRERVLDSDLDVCQVAAGCLANYVTLLASMMNTTTSSSTSAVEQAQAMTAGWTLVLVGRLQQCYQHVTQLSNIDITPIDPTTVTDATRNTSTDKKKKHVKNQTKSSSSNNNNLKSITKQKKQWLALAVQCLRALCILMESNPQAVGRLTVSSLDKTPRQDFHQTLLEWLQYGLQQISSSIEEDDMVSLSLEQIMTLAAQTLHSAWDDNADLLLPWMEDCPEAFQRAVKLLQDILQAPTTPAAVAPVAVIAAPPAPPVAAAATTTITAEAGLRVPRLPVVAQLHATGAFLAARQTMVGLMATSSPQGALVETTHKVVIPLLERYLPNSKQSSWTNNIQSLLTTYQDTLVKWEKEQADDAMERDVIRKVKDRNEPARDIARRQKAQRDAAEELEQNNSTTANDTSNKPVMDEDDEDPDRMEEDNNNNNSSQVETREALEQARAAWNDFLLPLQLSLELLTNLTSNSNSPTGNHDEDDDDMMMEWGADQEAQWIQEQEKQQLQTSAASSSGDKALQQSLVHSQLPQRLLQLFRQVYHIPPAITFPEQSHQDVEDLQSKTLACLGNCWENVEAWPQIDLTWQELQQATASATGLGKEAVVSAMVIALKTYPSLRKEWKPEHLSAWLHELQPLPLQHSNKDTNHRQEEKSNHMSVRRDVINMLGLLCTLEPHPIEVNRQVCTGLLQAMTNFSDSFMIQCEVLNVLMDMYGNDEDDGCCYPSVFESLQVLSHFQRYVPTLKSKLKEQERKLRQQRSEDAPDADLVEVEQWKETILNASRFVQYKKGQL